MNKDSPQNETVASLVSQLEKASEDRVALAFAHRAASVRVYGDGNGVTITRFAANGEVISHEENLRIV